jgi:hypothetical protein
MPEEKGQPEVFVLHSQRTPDLFTPRQLMHEAEDAIVLADARLNAFQISPRSSSSSRSISISQSSPEALPTFTTVRDLAENSRSDSPAHPQSDGR